MTQRIYETCQVDGCTNRHKARGYCEAHYQQFKRGVPIRAQIRTRDLTPREHCIEEGCTEPVKARGLCHAHYQRFLRHGHTRYRDRKKPAKPCAIAGCTNWHYAKGFCHQHYLRMRRLKDRYGLTLEQVADMLAAQGGVCAICEGQPVAVNGHSGKAVDFHVDHDHETNEVRGLLCAHCNRGIGLFQDDPAILRRAAAYLDRHRPPTA